MHGRVQGVGFRYTTERRARALELTGYVRNEADGTVLVVAEGRPDRLGKLLDWVRRGPPGARVAAHPAPPGRLPRRVPPLQRRILTTETDLLTQLANEEIE